MNVKEKEQQAAEPAVLEPATGPGPFRPQNLPDCQAHLRAYFDALAPRREAWRRRNIGYHRMIERQYRFLIPPGARVLEAGCGTGDLLAALEPAVGVGLDLSPAMTALARKKFPQAELRFEALAIEDFEAPGEVFDYIILSDLPGYLYDIEAVFERLKRFCHPRTRVIVNFHSHLWQPLFTLAVWLRLKARQPVMNWVTPEDVRGLLGLCGYEVLRSYPRILLPKRIPLMTAFCNRFLAPWRPFRWFCVANFIVARLPMRPLEKPPTVSVVCPCRNEAGNIAEIVRRLPKLGARTELIFVEGHSQDETYAQCLKAQRENAALEIQVHRQGGKGKGDAVRLGFEKARGEVLVILDADLSVAPEDLPHFVEALTSGRVEFVNGSRLVYPMEGRAMRFLNLCANKFFGLAFSFLLGQPIRDTLCGTKVLLKSDYEKIAAGRSYFGDFDPFGDFDLLFGAAKLNLKIQDLPIRYRDRTYGETNISRFRHGWMLLRMCGLAFRRLKCQ